VKYSLARWWIVASASAVVVSTLGPAVTTGAATRRTAIPAYSIRLEDQILAELHYLPLAFVASGPKAPTPTTTTTTTTTLPTSTTTSIPTSTTTSSTTTTTTTTAPPRKGPAPDPASLQRGRYVWRFTSLPAAFKQNWSVGTDNVIVRGALMRFQSDHGLIATGAMDGFTWHALVVAARQHRGSTAPYNMVLVTQSLPQKLELFQNGRVTFTSLVNTGISVSPTANGTFPVYLRYTTTTMSGTNPNGQPYHDTGIPWVSYFNGGDALHGFIRPGYGYPQSLGCVEMPFAQARALWPHTPIGTLVTVQP
jgi:L,D-transpeptidase catalytic domain